MKAFRVLAAFFLVVCSGRVLARQAVPVYRPEAVLVQLRSEKKRIAYLEQQGRHEDALQVKKDIKAANEAMVSDFKDHFRFCPVYFYFDTNSVAIMSGTPEGLLLNSDLSPAANAAVRNGSNNYYLVYFGQPEIEKDSRGQAASRTLSGQGLVMTNYEGRQMTSPFPFYTYSNRGYYHVLTSNSKYDYLSKKNNIEYYRLAGELSASLSDFFRK